MYDKNSVEKKIRQGWIAGLITSGLGIFYYIILYLLIGNRFWARIEGIDVMLTLLMLGLTVGIYNKNRAAAVIALVVFVLSRIVIWSAAFMMLSQSRSGSGVGPLFCIGIPIGLILIRMFYLGVEGTFTYHRNIETSPS